MCEEVVRKKLHLCSLSHSLASFSKSHISPIGQPQPARRSSCVSGIVLVRVSCYVLFSYAAGSSICYFQTRLRPDSRSIQSCIDSVRRRVTLFRIGRLAFGFSYPRLFFSNLHRPSLRLLGTVSSYLFCHGEGPRGTSVFSLQYPGFTASI